MQKQINIKNSNVNIHVIYFYFCQKFQIFYQTVCKCVLPTTETLSRANAYDREFVGVYGFHYISKQNSISSGNITLIKIIWELDVHVYMGQE